MSFLFIYAVQVLLETSFDLIRYTSIINFYSFTVYA